MNFKPFIYLALCLQSIAVFAQPNLFVKQIGNDQMNTVNAFYPDTLNAYYISGAEDNNHSFWAVIDTSGNVLQSMKFNETIPPFESISELSNGDFLVHTIHNDDILIVRIDKLGNIIWAKTYHHRIESNAFVIPSTNNHHIIVANSNPSGKEHDLIAFKIDDNGTIIWTMHIDNADEVLTDATTNGKGGAVITGMLGGTAKPNPTLFFVEIDHTGNAVLFKQFDHSQGQEINPVITHTKDGGYAVAGVIDSNGLDGFIYKTNQSFLVEWSYLFSNKNDEYVLDIEQDTAGTRYFVSSQYDYGSNKRNVVSTFPADGSSVSTTRLDDIDAIYLQVLPSDLLLLRSSASLPIGFGQKDGLLAFSGPSIENCFSSKDYMAHDTTSWITDKWAPVVAGLNVTTTPFTLTTSASNINDTIGCCPVKADFHTENGACTGDTLHVTNNTKNGKYYEWYLDGQLISTDTNIYLYFKNKGHHYLELKTGDSVCVDLHGEPIKIDSLPPFEFPNDTTICPNIEWLYIPTCLHCDFLWDNGSETGTRMFDEPGTYWLEVIHACGTLSDTFSIQELDAPIPSISHEINYSCEQTLIHLSFECVDCDSHEWINGNGGTSTANEIDVPISQGQSSYKAVVAYFYESCIDTLEEVIDLPYGDLAPDKLANCFSPNGDGINDCFKFTLPESMVSCYQLSIFNRWGQQIFSSDDIHECWEGTFEGSLLAKGSYFYLLEFAGNHYKGIIQLQ